MSDQLIQKKPGGKVLSFGELLLRICPDADANWLSENQLPFFVGGAELNVATALAKWEVPSKYLTALPDNDMSAQLIAYLNKKEIDTSAIVKTGERLGLYFLTRGKDLKHGALIYDRANSSFAGLKPGVIDWKSVLNGVSWFHFSAICPAINQNVADVCKEALIAAKKMSITVSVDLNYRAKLWQYGKSPLEIMPELVTYCDVVMGNIWAAEKMLGIEVRQDIHELDQLLFYREESLRSSRAILNAFPACRVVANTFRFDSTIDINYSTTLLCNDQFYQSKEYNTREVGDRVGSGDCFMAGLIYGFYNRLAPQEILEFATAAAFEKLFIIGDATSQTVAEIKYKI